LKNLIVNDAEAQNAADVTTLLASTEGSLALVGKMHMGLLDRPAFDVAVARGKDAKADVRGLFETFVPEADRRATLGPDIKPETILDIAGNASRGQLIFLSDSARCRNCHDLSSRRADGPGRVTNIRHHNHQRYANARIPQHKAPATYEKPTHQLTAAGAAETTPRDTSNSMIIAGPRALSAPDPQFDRVIHKGNATVQVCELHPVRMIAGQRVRPKRHARPIAAAKVVRRNAM
jgi:hypothetical protein